MDKIWDKDIDMPTLYDKDRILHPCQKCRRMRLDNGGQAVGIHARDEKGVFMRCKACGHVFELPHKKCKFPKDTKCDGCGGSTKAYSTNGRVQYRRCEKCKKSLTVKAK